MNLENKPKNGKPTMASIEKTGEQTKGKESDVK